MSSAVAYAQIDISLADLLKDETTRTILRRTLLTAYFSNQTATSAVNPDTYLDDLKREMLEESPIEYRAKLKVLKTKVDPETYQIEVYARYTLFRREIVRLYDDTCCINGVCVSAPYSFSMVDACYIVPFYKTFNNHPTNGIALCLNLHRAFDKGAIAIDDDYRVIVSETFIENDNSDYSFKALSGKKTELPRDGIYTPDIEAFVWHRKHTFKG